MYILCKKLVCKRDTCTPDFAMYAFHWVFMCTYIDLLILFVFCFSHYTVSTLPFLEGLYIQDVTGGKDQTSGGCSLC